jgi:hypothetical protein
MNIMLLETSACIVRLYNQYKHGSLFFWDMVLCDWVIGAWLRGHHVVSKQWAPITE